MTKQEKKVIWASSLGTVFEWYDFGLYGTLAVVLGQHFFSAFDPAIRNVFVLLAFAAGFLVRPFGAALFGRIGDLSGRKYTFLITIILMGLATFLVGVLPTYGSIGIAAPICLIVLRMILKVLRSAASTVALRFTSPNMPRAIGADTTRAGFRRQRISAFS